MDRRFLFAGGAAIVVLLMAIVAVAILSTRHTNETIQTSIVQTPSRLGKTFFSNKRRAPVQSEDGAYAKRGVITPAFGRDVARSILDWLNGQRVYGQRLENPSQYGEFICDGGYSTGTFCTSDKKCIKNLPANNIGLIATWAHYQYYKYVERDKEVMSVISKDIETYENTKKISVLQPVTTNFKHMYELWSEGEFDDVRKEQIKNILYRMQHDPSVVDPVQNEIKATGTIQNPRPITTVRPYGDIAQFSVSSPADLYSIISSEYAYTYLFIRQTHDDPDEAKYLYTSIALYNKAVAEHNNPYYLGIAALDLYKVTNDAFYLRQAEVIANLTNAYPCGNLDRCAPRIYFLHQLGKSSGDQTYVRKRNELLTPLIMNSYDSDGLAGYKFGYNAFYGDDTSLNERYQYWLDANALMVSVLVEL